MTVKLDRLDHLVLTVRDVEATCRFYERALGMHREEFGADRIAGHKIDRIDELMPWRYAQGCWHGRLP